MPANTQGEGKGSENNSGTALVVHPELEKKVKTSSFEPSLEDKLEEAVGLARAIFLDVLDTRTFQIKKPSPGHLIGKGNREDIGVMVKALKPDVVIVNHNLSPIQQRNLERAWKAKVIDRTGLILEIFGERAQTREGKIQVELAALEYQRSRLVKSWTHLERQRGGLGKTGGPGETQIELDRRMITDRIAKLKKDLQDVRKTRELQRRSREKVPFPIVALVGYTNAGKSTLFNHLTGADVYAEDLPFATLDTTMRRLTLSGGQEVILSDTVGFIADLPTHLVAAFRATLEQLEYADIILHVRDVSRPDHESQKEDVIAVLKDLGIDYEGDERIMEVWNKIDAVPLDERVDVMRKAKFAENTVSLSALTGEGTDHLLEMVEIKLAAANKVVLFEIPAFDGKALAWLHENANVLDNRENGENMVIEIEIAPEDLGRFHERFPYKELENEQNDKKRIYGNEY